ncbi:MAG: DUF1015 domain-containing protein [Spirochaetia bacterium]|nr:DUF1015 domain-containing protein [Spirochaetia bacterium]
MNKKTFNSFGIKIPKICMPNKHVDLRKWSVVACDQYTSERKYWKDVEEFVGDSPSTLNLIFPEVYLEDGDKDKKIESINAHMHEYINEGILEEMDEAFFLIHRHPDGAKARWGLVAAIDLEQYDYTEGSTSLIRATEGTILDRIPPRKLIRKDAPLELPHILVLLDDEDQDVIEPLTKEKDYMKKIYDFDLMKSGGHITAYLVDKAEYMEKIASGLKKLADPSAFKTKYGTDDVLLFAMGDGNHSLATAKSCWEDIKKENKYEDILDHPARWALVEIENIHDKGLVFEPIHRVLFNAERDKFEELLNSHCDSINFISCNGVQEILELLQEQTNTKQRIGYTDADHTGIYELHNPSAVIPAGTVQQAIDSYVAEDKEVSVDYIHGKDVTYSLGKADHNIGIFLPAIDKKDFFRSIVKDGALPRKTFSMGEAHEKRFYIESRKITL